jgi:hypothetical protein
MRTKVLVIWREDIYGRKYYRRYLPEKGVIIAKNN